MEILQKPIKESEKFLRPQHNKFHINLLTKNQNYCIDKKKIQKIT